MSAEMLRILEEWDEIVFDEFVIVFQDSRNFIQ